ncbi:MAG TPA: putative ABC transporter permease [Patescibacteria group bacterium]|nr:putative ABC transporter permease [Patescibacteria group bacterium]
MIVKTLIFFCAYSVIGWIIDTAARSVRARRYVRGGFSRYPFSPIYGFAALGIMALAPYVRPWPLWGEWLFFAVVLAAYEYVCGALILRRLGRRLWNYSKDKWDIDGHTGPIYAAAWGLLALFTIYLMHPFLERLLVRLAI